MRRRARFRKGTKSCCGVTRVDKEGGRGARESLVEAARLHLFIRNGARTRQFGDRVTVSSVRGGPPIVHRLEENG
jgi:hypothetical protein